MANDEPSSGFLSRWSRRKTEVREGRALDEPTPPAVASAQAMSVAGPTSPVAHEASLSHAPSEVPMQVAAPTLADAAQLTHESDFTSFMARDVAPDVKNAAMKKLFTDPHFNVMDRMDVYIDDYSQLDPLPAGMLQKMASAQFMRLVDDAQEQEPTDTGFNGDPSTPGQDAACMDMPSDALNKKPSMDDDGLSHQRTCDST